MVLTKYKSFNRLVRKKNSDQLTIIIIDKNKNFFFFLRSWKAQRRFPILYARIFARHRIYRKYSPLIGHEIPNYPESFSLSVPESKIWCCPILFPNFCPQSHNYIVLSLPGLCRTILSVFIRKNISFNSAIKLGFGPGVGKCLFFFKFLVVQDW